MNKFIIFALIALAGGAVIAYKAIAQHKPDETMVTENKKILVAYYSYSGNTKEVAELIAQETAGDLFEIKTEGTYPEEYRPMTQQAKKEIQDGYRPKLITSVENMEQYDIVFLGSPNWWGTITPQVSSFIETYKLSGKTVIPFITHGGGGEQNTITDMANQCKDCHVIKAGWVGYGSRTMGVTGWLKDLGFVE